MNAAKKQQAPFLKINRLRWPQYDGETDCALFSMLVASHLVDGSNPPRVVTKVRIRIV